MADFFKDPESEAILQELVNPASRLTLSQTETAPDAIAALAANAVMARIEQAELASGEKKDVECLITPAVRKLILPQAVDMLPHIVPAPALIHGDHDFLKFPFTKNIFETLSHNPVETGLIERAHKKRTRKILKMIAAVSATENRKGAGSTLFSEELGDIFREDKAFQKNKEDVCHEPLNSLSMIHLGKFDVSWLLSSTLSKVAKLEAPGTLRDYLTFVLFHEIGHSWYKYIKTGGSFFKLAEDDTSENSADCFAANLYTRLVKEGRLAGDPKVPQVFMGGRCISALMGESSEVYNETAALKWTGTAWISAYSGQDITKAIKNICRALDQMMGICPDDDTLINKVMEGSPKARGGLKMFLLRNTRILTYGKTGKDEIINNIYDFVRKKDNESFMAKDLRDQLGEDVLAFLANNIRQSLRMGSIPRYLAALKSLQDINFFADASPERHLIDQSLNFVKAAFPSVGYEKDQVPSSRVQTHQSPAPV